jgi:hypothetical protein
MALLTAAGDSNIEWAWIEADLSSEGAPTSAFIPGDASHSWELIISALQRTLGIDHGATSAARRVRDLVLPLKLYGIAGSYANRQPPVAGTALRVAGADLPNLLDHLRDAGALTLDPAGPEIAWLLENLDEHCITVAAAAEGTVMCGVESRFEHNIMAARDGSWSRILAQPQPWTVNPARVAALDALPGAWRYSGPLPTVLVTGVSHLKVSPAPHAPRAKVYFGGRIELGGVR